MRHDHKVPFRSEESLAKEALACRQFAGNENFLWFNVVDFVERVLPQILARMKKGNLKIEFFDSSEGDTLAYVSFKPMTLHVDRQIWDLANLGEPEAKFIIAHEVGHIILHDHYAQAFSNDPSKQIKFVQVEERAEWQANTFASYFSIPPHILNLFANSKELSRSCEVPQLLADERFEAAVEEKLRFARCARAAGYTGDACTKCGNFTLRNTGLNTKCDTCGYARSVGNA